MDDNCFSVDEIRNLLSVNSSIQCVYVSRKSNLAVDMVAKLAINLDMFVAVWLEVGLDWLSSIFHVDLYMLNSDL